MKKFIAISALSLLAISIVACGGAAPASKDYSKEVDMGTLIDHDYKCKELGWETTFPKGPLVTPKSDLVTQKKLTQQASGQEVSEPSNEIKHLLAYGFDMNNNFQSTAEYFKGKTETDYKLAVKGIHEAAYNNYFNARIRVDTSATQLKVGDITFDVWTINLYDENAKAYGHQEMYTTVLKDYFFSAVLAYDDVFYKEKMLPTITKATYK